MIYGLFILLVVAYSYLNARRGSGKVKKVICYAGYAILFAICIYCNDPSIGLGLLLGLPALSFMVDWVSNSWGWGDFFPDKRDGDTGDFELADWSADLFQDRDSHILEWQTTALGFRFMLTHGCIGIPLFALVTGNWWYLCAIPMFMLSGLIYAGCFMKETLQSVRNAEYFNGLLMGSIRGAILFIL